jgi:CRP-like cAMP-binding protein
MTPAELQQVRVTPLFAELPDSVLDCLAAGEIIEMAAGNVLAQEGQSTGFFYVLLEGEVRIVRNYDGQSILMAVTKPGAYLGEVMLLLGVPWVSTARVSKAARLFRLNEEGFWRMLTQCPQIGQQVFRSAASRMRNFEGYSQQREKLASLGTMAAGLAHELNNPAAAARRAAAHLRETTDKVQTLLCQLGKVLEHDHWQILLNASLEASEHLDHAPVLDHLTRSAVPRIMAHGSELYTAS